MSCRGPGYSVEFKVLVLYSLSWCRTLIHTSRSSCPVFEDKNWWPLLGPVEITSSQTNKLVCHFIDIVQNYSFLPVIIPESGTYNSINRFAWLAYKQGILGRWLITHPIYQRLQWAGEAGLDMDRNWGDLDLWRTWKVMNGVPAGASDEQAAAKMNLQLLLLLLLRL